MQEYLDFAAHHPFLMGAVSALVAMILFTEARRLTRRYEEISAAEAVQLMNRESAWTLDVREDKEIQDGVIPSARRVALSELPKRVGELKDQKGPVIAYCKNGVQAHRACRILAREGLEPVYNLKGGIAAWREAGMPLEASA